MSRRRPFEQKRCPNQRHDGVCRRRKRKPFVVRHGWCRAHPQPLVAWEAAAGNDYRFCPYCGHRLIVCWRREVN